MALARVARAGNRRGAVRAAAHRGVMADRGHLATSPQLPASGHGTGVAWPSDLARGLDRSARHEPGLAHSADLRDEEPGSSHLRAGSDSPAHVSAVGRGLHRRDGGNALLRLARLENGATSRGIALDRGPGALLAGAPVRRNPLPSDVVRDEVLTEALAKAARVHEPDGRG